MTTESAKYAGTVPCRSAAQLSKPNNPDLYELSGGASTTCSSEGLRRKNYEQSSISLVYHTCEALDESLAEPTPELIQGAAEGGITLLQPRESSSENTSSENNEYRATNKSTVLIDSNINNKRHMVRVTKTHIMNDSAMDKSCVECRVCRRRLRFTGSPQGGASSTNFCAWPYLQGGVSF